MQTVKLRQLCFNLFLLLLIFMPLHYVLFSLILGDMKAISLWRDIIIIILMLYSIRNKKIGLRFYERNILLAIVIIVIYCITALSSHSINVARIYIMPMLIYFYICNEHFTKKEINKILNIIWIMGVAESVYGLYQALVLKSSFLIDLGYSSINGRLASSSFYIYGNWTQQRVVGTFVSPNNCGFYLAVSIIILLTMAKYTKMKRVLYYLGIVIIGFGLLGTLSRSAWVGCFAGLIFFNIKRIKLQEKKLINLVIMIFVLLIAVIVIDRYILNSKISNIVFEHTINTLNRESSTNAHIRELYEPLAKVIQHPFGLGFGKNGSFALSAFSAKEVNLVESSVYVLCYDVGIIGTIIILLNYVKSIVCIKDRKNDRFALCVGKVAICILLVYISLPSIQAYEQPFMFYMCLGFAEAYRRGYIDIE